MEVRVEGVTREERKEELGVQADQDQDQNQVKLHRSKRWTIQVWDKKNNENI